jgi:hypothetical protein
MGGMNAKRGKGGASRALVFAAIGLLVLLPFLYVLSYGPVSWFFLKGYMTAGVFDTFYAPLRWACGICSPLDSAVQ